MDPTAALQALIGRETTAPRTVAAAAPTGPKRGMFRSSGGGATPTMTAGDGAMALASAPQGRHSFVQNMWGANQTGGFVNAGEGPNSVYGGWRVTDDPGATIDPRMAPRIPQFAGEPSVTDMQQQKTAEVNALTPSLAANQWRERQEAMARGRK
jgi:hypothetical protein